jgi:hypothetical protein
VQQLQHRIREDLRILLGKIVPNPRDNPMLSLRGETVGLRFGGRGWIDSRLQFLSLPLDRGRWF